MGKLKLLSLVILFVSSAGWADYPYYDYSSPHYYGGYSGYSGGYGSSSQNSIISLDMNPQDLLNSSFRIAAREERIDDMEKLLQQGANVDSPSEDGQTALLYGARRCSPVVVDFLLKHNANVNAKDAKGRNALIVSARGSCVRVVELLLKKRGLQVDIQDCGRKTALDYALDNSVLEVGGPSQEIVSMIKNFHSKSRNFLR